MATQVLIDSGKTRDPHVLTDDTEEDLVGTDLHQRAIRTLCENLLYVQEKRGTPWHVGMQLTTLMGDVPDKEDWQPSPDILVHLTAGPDDLSSLDAAALGAPQLVIEVLSRSTWKYDPGRRKPRTTTQGYRSTWSSIRPPITWGRTYRRGVAGRVASCRGARWPAAAGIVEWSTSPFVRRACCCA